MKIYSCDAGGEYPIHGAYWGSEYWIPAAWTVKGETFAGQIRSLDIVREA